MGSMDYLARAQKLGIRHDFTGVGCSGNYLTRNSSGKPITASKSREAAFEAQVEAAEKKASQLQLADQ